MLDRLLPDLPPFNNSGHGGCTSGCIGSYRHNRFADRVSYRGFGATQTVRRYLKFRSDI